MHDNWMMDGYLFVGGLAITVLTYLVAKKQLTMTRFTRFLGILMIATASSLVPFWIIGLIMGFPSVVLASILIAVFLDKENK